MYVPAAAGDSAQSLYDRGKTLKQETEADSLWGVFEAEPDHAVTLTPEETSRLNELLGRAGSILKSRVTVSNLSPGQKEKLTLRLETARDLLRQAAALNPYERRIREALASTLERLARLHESMDDLTEANRIYQDILRGNPGRFVTHYYIGVNAYKLARYDRALEHLRAAEDIIVLGAYSDKLEEKGEEVAYPPLRLSKSGRQSLLTILSWEQECESKLGLTENVACTLRRILDIAAPEESESYAKQLDRLQRYGGVDELEGVKEYWRLYKEEAYEDARALGLELLDRLQGRPGYWDMMADLATLEYYRLGEREAAVERMKRVAERAVDMGIVDEEDQKNLDYFGSWCQAIASEHLGSDTRKAFEYYLMGSKVDWGYPDENDVRQSGRAYCYYQLALLSSTKPEICEEYARKALEAEVAPEYRRHVLNLLVDSLREQNHMVDAAIYYDELRELASREEEPGR